jgi:hypothetical protein
VKWCEIAHYDESKLQMTVNLWFYGKNEIDKIYFSGKNYELNKELLLKFKEQASQYSFELIGLR